jgi:hypothetical protein
VAHLHVVHEHRTSQRYTESELVLDSRGVQALHSLHDVRHVQIESTRESTYLFQDKSADLVIPLATSPDDEHIAASDVNVCIVA